MKLTQGEKAMLLDQLEEELGDVELAESALAVIEAFELDSDLDEDE